MALSGAQKAGTTPEDLLTTGLRFVVVFRESSVVAEMIFRRL